ncbi:four helix bundle protein [Autumnicola psychrophila]|uniref:four helix bundle protein n=1 Tax=Autumnicola psychrophila TaxID=3075592 RepID=UPI003D77F06E
MSVPSNIAEGASRESPKKFSRFLEIAMGSCYEIETQLLISNNLGFIEARHLETLKTELDSIIKMISKFRSTIKSRI